MYSSQAGDICHILSVKSVHISDDTCSSFDNIKPHDVAAAIGTVTDKLGQDIILMKYCGYMGIKALKELEHAVFMRTMREWKRGHWIRSGVYSHNDMLKIVREAIWQILGDARCPQCQGTHMDDKGRTCYFYHDKGKWDVCDACGGDGTKHPVMDETIQGRWLERCRWIIFMLSDAEEVAKQQIAVKLTEK